jgi:hypothetical protein
MIEMDNGEGLINNQVNPVCDELTTIIDENTVKAIALNSKSENA